MMVGYYSHHRLTQTAVGNRCLEQDTCSISIERMICVNLRVPADFILHRFPLIIPGELSKFSFILYFCAKAPVISSPGGIH